MFKRKFQTPVAGAAGAPAARRAFLPPLQNAAAPAAEATAAEPAPAVPAAAVAAVPCAAPPAAAAGQQQQAITPAKASASGGQAEPSGDVAPQPAAPPPPPPKPKPFVQLAGLRAKRKAAEPATDGKAAAAAEAEAGAADAAAVPAPAPIAPAAAPAPAKGWVVKRLPSVQAPGDLPQPPTLPSAEQLLGCLPVMPAAAADVVPLDAPQLGSLGAAAAALEAGLLPLPLALPPGAPVLAAEDITARVLGGPPAQLQLRSKHQLPAALGSPLVNTARQPAAPVHKPALPAATPAAAAPAVLRGQQAAPHRAAVQPQPQLQAPPPLDEAWVCRQLTEAVPISLSTLRRLVFA